MKKRSVLSVLCGVSAAILVASCDPAPKSDAKEISAFSIKAPAEPGVIKDSTITVQAPRGTDLKSLVADFTTTGVRVTVGSVPQTSGETANDFSSPVTYTVTAEDNSTKNYKVVVSYYKRCLFLSAAADPNPIDPRDTALITKVRSWKYDVTVKMPFPVSAWTADSFAQFDFAFLSETPNSSDYGFLKGHPLPILNIEAWAADKGTVLNWGMNGSTVANHDPKVCVITGPTGHPLTAGLPNGKEFKLVDSTTVAGEAAIAFIPAINVIPIAAFRDSLNLVCACAIEEGTLLADSATTAKNRAVTIGIHAHAYPYITEDAYKLMQAGIRWILKQTESVTAGM